jgi:hypothetical protein
MVTGGWGCIMCVGDSKLGEFVMMSLRKEIGVGCNQGGV